MQEIPLTQGQVALVDDLDYEFLNQWKWHALRGRNEDFYAVRNSSRKNGKQHKIFMHRVILGLKHKNPHSGDHVNHNTLDNRQANIRICTHLENMMNRKSTQDSSSQFKGVFWQKEKKKWRAQIKIDGKAKHLGDFKAEKNAALAYDMAAIREFGYFAHLNFPSFQRSLIC